MPRPSAPLRETNRRPIATLMPTRPKRRGNQAYLFQISQGLAAALAQFIDRWVLDLVNGNPVLEVQPDRSAENLREWEERVEASIVGDPVIAEIEKRQMVMARRGQGLYRSQLVRLESHCRLTRVRSGVQSHYARCSRGAAGSLRRRGQLTRTSGRADDMPGFFSGYQSLQPVQADTWCCSVPGSPGQLPCSPSSWSIFARRASASAVSVE